MVMSNRGINPGDYLVTKNGQVFRIINKVTKNGQSTYDITSMFSVYYPEIGHYDTIKRSGLAHNQLRHLGTIIPEENATDLFKILYE